MATESLFLPPKTHKKQKTL